MKIPIILTSAKGKTSEELAKMEKRGQEPFILGLLTWFKNGEFAGQGIVQNIHNIFQDW